MERDHPQSRIVPDRCGRAWRSGESFEFGGYRLTVVEMNRRGVARVIITSIARIRPVTARSAE